MTGSKRPTPRLEEATLLVRLGAAAGSGDADALTETLDLAEGTLDTDDIEEYLLQTYLFAGYPRMINAFYTWQGWANDHGGRGALVMEPDDTRVWRERGEKLCRLIYSGTFEALQTRLARLHPALAEWTLTEGYGKVLARPGPDVGRRELAAIGALIVLGAERQLHSHLKGALNAGVDEGVLEQAVRSVADAWDRRDLVEPLLTNLYGR